MAMEVVLKVNTFAMAWGEDSVRPDWEEVSILMVAGRLHLLPRIVRQEKNKAIFIPSFWFIFSWGNLERICFNKVSELS